MKSGLELQARDIFFRKVQVSSAEIRASVLHPLVLTFILIATSAFVAFDAAQLWVHMALWQASMVWLLAIGVQLGLFVIFTLAWAWGQAHLRLPTIFLPILGLSAYAINYPLTVLHVGLQSGRDFSEVMVPAVLVSGIFFSLIFEAIYFAFVFPLVHQSFADKNPAKTREISIAGEIFRVDQILTLKGQEHFVLVTTQDGDHRLRARLGDIVSQTHEHEGILAHRSHWISCHAIAGLEHENGGDIILTHAGERLPVARPRQGEVRGWIEQHASKCTP